MKPLKTHFIGVGGIGMSALARLLLLKDMQVSGSDSKGSSLIEGMQKMGLKAHEGHDPKNLPDEGRVIVSTGIRSDNLELKACVPGRHQVMHRSDLLKELMEEQKPLLVVGSHGKTTTSALLATVLTESGYHPSWAVGGIVSAYGTNAALGSGAYFVAEGDESDGTHEKYCPYGLICTNIDEEHMDHYGTKEKLYASFKRLYEVVKEKKHFFYCADDSGNLALGLKEGTSYGFSERADLRLFNFSQKGGELSFDFTYRGVEYQGVTASLLGRHNALNVAAVTGLLLSLDVPFEKIKTGLRAFKGTKRRADVRLKKYESVVIEDYAHHPSEIEPTLEALYEAYPDKNLTVFFQPHRYSRTQACLKQFKKAFDKASKVYITDIYSAGEPPIEGIDAEAVVKEIGRGAYVPRDRLEAFAVKHLKPFEVLVFMGAGDIGQAAERVAMREPGRLKVGCVFGGQSAEHEVSLVSAKGVISHLDPKLFDIEYFAITRQGEWLSGKAAKLYLEEGSITPSHNALEDLKGCDLAYPILHGPNGEDGTIQGLFEMLSIPYVGCNVEASAISMNKATSKKLAALAGVPIVPFVSFTKPEWALEREDILKAIEEKLSYPLFVKAAHLGSSIGVYKVGRKEDLLKAIGEAFRYDRELVIENGVKGRELECAIIGEGPWQVTDPGEILTGGDFYDYDKKYGSNGFATKVTADLDDKVREEVKELSLRVYRAIGCDSMARVDLFLTDAGLYFSEVNPIPGCTAISLFPKMFEAKGLQFTPLVTELIRLSLKRKHALV